jgi:Ca-activated chloride channel homolog
MPTKCLVILAVLFLAVTSMPRAQDPAPAAPPSGQMVALSLIVTDKDDKGVNTIRKDQVRVLEDGVEQAILSIEADERPIDYGIAIDASGSVRTVIESALQAVRLIIVNRRPADQLFIERFISTDKIEKYRDFTTDGNALIQSLNNFTLEGGRSAVIDGLYKAVEYVAEYNKGNEARRKAVVIITDGEDRESTHSQEGLIRLLHERGVQVFVIGLVMNLDKEGGFVRTSPRQRAEKLLKTIAAESGGRVFFPEKKEQLIDAAQEISLDLRAQYRIKYQSTNATAKSGFRTVEAKFVSPDGPKRKLIVPPGYYAGTTDLTSEPEKKP